MSAKIRFDDLTVHLPVDGARTAEEFVDAYNALLTVARAAKKLCDFYEDSPNSAFVVYQELQKALVALPGHLKAEIEK